MTIQEELAKIKANFDRYLADLEAAAGELKIPVPEPGSDLAKLLAANVLLRRRVAQAADPGIQSDWERAHALLDTHGVLTVQSYAIGEHLIDRLKAVLKVWDAIGQHSGQACHDLRFLCNSTPEVNAAIDAYRASYRQPRVTKE